MQLDIQKWPWWTWPVASVILLPLSVILSVNIESWIHDQNMDRLYESPGWLKVVQFILHYAPAFALGLAIGMIIWQWRASSLPSTSLIQQPAKSIQDTQILFNSAIEPASRAIDGILNMFVRAIAHHPNPSVKSLIQVVQSGARNPASTAMGNLYRALHGIDSVDEDTLQHLVGWYWEQYRCQRGLILANHESMKEAGTDLPATPQFKPWLDADQRLVEALRQYCAPQERQIIRTVMKSVWDEQVRDALVALKPSPGAIPSLQSRRSTTIKKRR